MVQDDPRCCCHTKPHPNLTRCMGSGSHFAFPLEITASLPAASAPSRCGHQPWTGSRSPCPETPLLGALGLTGCTEPRSSFIHSISTRLQSVIHGNNIPALERGALSVPPVNSDVYLGNNSPPSSPLYWNSRTFFFFFLPLISRKNPRISVLTHGFLILCLRGAGLSGGSLRIEVSPCAAGHGRGECQLPNPPN